MAQPSYRVLLVCMGNICRSPTAEGVLRQKIREAGLSDSVHIDSAGTHNFHPGEPPDPRSQTHALRRGYDLSNLRARQIAPEDFESFDLILAMDWDNQALLEAACPPQLRHKLKLIMTFASPSLGMEVPDPYFGGDAGFEQTLDLLEPAMDGLIGQITVCLGQSNKSASLPG